MIQWKRLSYEIHDKNKMRMRERRRKRRRSHRVLDPTHPELSVGRATLVTLKNSNLYRSYNESAINSSRTS